MIWLVFWSFMIALTPVALGPAWKLNSAIGRRIGLIFSRVFEGSGAMEVSTSTELRSILVCHPDGWQNSVPEYRAVLGTNPSRAVGGRIANDNRDALPEDFAAELTHESTGCGRYLMLPFWLADPDLDRGFGTGEHGHRHGMT
ncbi:hypothetical protein [Tautonia plasticadhaerens]|uniref:Uncharacterized protein n=1 Tax=Tautonia plasticadhaerens TaxID=2527974 RepID=A0A518HF02_9BACT|nr:hypothetical protein [Tautonia plasticadhaerens]QDV39414.1 hypothetical protein ElP_73810 [Tautonia plasticadhaerens]